jgi:ATP-binding cassette subfamily G (WHITE) protein 2 (PDR)
VLVPSLADRLLFLAAGGKTIYFGEVGEESKHLRAYFERNGSPVRPGPYLLLAVCRMSELLPSSRRQKFPHGVNPAEYMLEVIGAAPGSHTDIDWHETWKASPEREGVKEELARLRQNPKSSGSAGEDDKWAYKQFAAPLWVQFVEVQKRYVCCVKS